MDYFDIVNLIRSIAVEYYLLFISIIWMINKYNGHIFLYIVTVLSLNHLFMHYFMISKTKIESK